RAPELAAAELDAAPRERARGRWRRAALLPIRYEAQQSVPLPPGRVWFVLETDRVLDRLILEDVCERSAWPQPGGAAAGLWSVRTIRGFLWRRRLAPRDVAELEAPIAHDRALGGGDDVAFVPVAIF